MEGANERVYRKVKEFVSQKQNEDNPGCQTTSVGPNHSPRGPGIRLEDIAQGIDEKEEQILLALSHKAWRGELVGADILITFNE